MTAHRSQSTPTPADAAIRQWSGTASEWDAERDLRADRLALAGYHIAHESRIKTATATMPPRPVELPSIETGLGWSVEWDGTFFSARQITTKNRALHDRRAHIVAAYVGATDDEYAKIAALRDGPAPRYEVCGWGVTCDGKTFTYGSYNSCESDLRAYADARVKEYGGTAHAIYRRVEGDK